MGLVVCPIELATQAIEILPSQHREIADFRRMFIKSESKPLNVITYLCIKPPSRHKK